jgi:hypothetical protein
VDVRQMSLFGAGWTLGSLKYLAESGAAYATLFETTGWLGVMERAAGAPLPDKFPSFAGGVYPLYHVLADVGDFAGGDVLTSRANEPLVVNSLALRKDGQTRVLLANYTEAPQTVTVQGLSGDVRVKTLDASSAPAALTDPAAYRAAAGEAVSVGPDGLTLTLPPYAIARVDA